MELKLKAHSISRESPIRAIRVGVRRLGGALALGFELRGDINRTRIPEERPWGRANELWKHTCFEAFVKSANGEAYYEFNLSPSRQWAAYRFERYREGMADVTEIEPSPFETKLRYRSCSIATVLPLALLDGLDYRRPWVLGMSAVVEDDAGAKTYWALTHPPGKPDFHHPDAFTLTIPPESS